MEHQQWTKLLLVGALLLSLAGGVRAQGPAGDGGPDVQAAIGTAFTYQGYLTDGGSPAEGSYDFRFRLYDAPSEGAQVGSPVVGDNVAVADGYFTVELDFGGAAFNGQARYLAIAVRPGGSAGAYTALSPRQPLTPTPYALYAQRVGSHDHLGDTWTGTDNPLAIEGSFARAPLELSNATGYGLRIGPSGDDGVRVYQAGGHGVYAAQTADDGFHVDLAGGNGLRVVSVVDDGVSVWSAGAGSTRVASDLSNGFEVAGARGNGLYVGRADNDGVYVDSAGVDGVRVHSAGRDGVCVGSAEGRGVYVDSAAGDGMYVNSADGDGLHVESAWTGVYVGSSEGHGVSVHSALQDGVQVDYARNDGVRVNSVEGRGIYVNSADSDGIVVDSADADGVQVNWAAGNGAYVSSAGHDGVNVHSAGSPSTANVSAGKNGFEVAGAESDGLYVGRADRQGVRVLSAGDDGVHVWETGRDGVRVWNAGGDGVRVNSAGNDGLHVTSAGGEGVYVGWAESDGVVVESAGHYAGYFGGTVVVHGELAKSSGHFHIDHPLDPENKYLNHSFVESPDMMNVYNGNVTTDEDGYATVRLPDYFEALNRDYRYQLTVIGTFAQAIIAQEVEDGQFVIQTDQPSVKVSWQVTGIRQDPWAEANRIVVEEDKPADERGTYLHPEVYGLPEERSLDYKEAQEREAERAQEAR
jgi:hypothetical protein